jgi:hypothetical protein
MNEKIQRMSTELLDMIKDEHKEQGLALIVNIIQAVAAEVTTYTTNKIVETIEKKVKETKDVTGK